MLFRSTFTTLIDYDKIQFEVNGKLIWEVQRIVTPTAKPVYCGDNIDYGTYYQLKAFPIEKMFMILNLALTNPGHGPGGAPGVDGTTVFPSSFDIDYLRVWTRVQEDANIFPTVSNGKWKIKSNLSFKLFSVKNTLGENISNYTFDIATNELNIFSSSDGIYFVTLDYNGNKKTLKVLMVSN